MEKESFCVTNKNMELEYLSEEYQKLKQLKIECLEYAEKNF